MQQNILNSFSCPIVLNSLEYKGGEGGGGWGREVGSAGVGWRDGEKMQTTVIE